MFIILFSKTVLSVNFYFLGDPSPAQIPEQKLVQVPSMDSKFSYDTTSDILPLGTIPRSPRSMKTVEEYRRENELLQQQLAKIGLLGNTDLEERCQKLEAQNEELERENTELVGQLSTEQEAVVALKEEREHLLATIQFMQGELDASEANRYTHRNSQGT